MRHWARKDGSGTVSGNIGVGKGDREAKAELHCGNFSVSYKSWGEAGYSCPLCMIITNVSLGGFVGSIKSTNDEKEENASQGRKDNDG